MFRVYFGNLDSGLSYQGTYSALSLAVMRHLLREWRWPEAESAVILPA